MQASLKVCCRYINRAYVSHEGSVVKKNGRILEMNPNIDVSCCSSLFPESPSPTHNIISLKYGFSLCQQRNHVAAGEKECPVLSHRFVSFGKLQNTYTVYTFITSPSSHRAEPGQRCEQRTVSHPPFLFVY